MAKEYIDREALEQFMASHKIRGDCKFCRNYEICVAQGLNRRGSHLYCWQEIILPAADVAEVRHGKWELIGTEKFMGGGYISIFRCSLCGREVEFCHKNDSDKYEYANTLYPYCHCGAKMDGKDDKQ